MKKLRAEYHARVDDLSSSYGVTPALAVILVSGVEIFLLAGSHRRSSY